MQKRLFDQTAVHVREAVSCDEGVRVYIGGGVFDHADLEPRDDAIQNWQVRIVRAGRAYAAAPSKDGDASLQLLGDGGPDLFVPGRDDRDRGVLLKTVEKKVDGFGSCDVREDRVECRLDAQKHRRGTEEKEITFKAGEPSNERTTASDNGS